VLNRNVVREFNPDRKDTMWGRWKLTRDTKPNDDADRDRPNLSMRDYRYRKRSSVRVPRRAGIAYKRPL
jgi:hypothetical protein